MPHLSPISWVLTPLTFILLLTLFVSTLWWNQTYSFPNINISSNDLQSNWNWN